MTIRMRTGTITQLTIGALLLTTVTVALAPSAAAVDPCSAYGICKDEIIDAVDPRTDCGADARWVAVSSGIFNDGCENDVDARWCTIRYMGGGSQWLVGNFVWHCYEIIA